MPRLEGEMPHSSQAALWASAARELWSCSDAEQPKAEQPKAGPGRHAAFGGCSLSGTCEKDVGVLLLPSLAEEEATGAAEVAPHVSKAISFQLKLGEDLVIAKFIKS